MSSDLFEYNYISEIHSYLVNKRDYAQIRPKNNLSYSPNESNLMFDATSLANSSTPNDWSNSFIYLPLTMIVEATGGDMTDTPQNVFALSLKNGVQNLINNLVIRYNNNMVNQNNSKHANIAITWELLKLTDQQLKLIADSMLFRLDSCDSCDYSAAASAGGIYELNNKIGDDFVVDGAANLVKDKLSLGKEGYSVNNGRLQRILNTNNIENHFISLEDIKKAGISYVEKSATQIVYYLSSIIPLSIFHDFFKQLGVVMGAKLEIELGLNTGVSELTIATGTYSAISNNFNKNSVVPFMISPIGRGLTHGAATKLTVSIHIGHPPGTSNAYEPVLFVKKVLYNGEIMEDFVSKKIKNISYMDYYSTSSNSVPTGKDLTNTEIFNSVARARYLLIVPEYDFTTSPSMSPFSSAPVTTAPYAKITNLQVYRSQNALFERPISYTFEHYNQHLLNLMSKDGGNLKSMEVSGQITKEMFDKCYGYHLIDLSQGASSLVSDSISQAYSITLTNISKFTVKYHFILFFNREININPTTSEIIV